MKIKLRLHKAFSKSIKRELSLIIVLTLLLSSFTVGLFSFYTAKRELDKT